LRRYAGSSLVTFVEAIVFPQFSILIPAFNEAALLPRTLLSVHACFAAVNRTLGEEVAYEIIVCDNNSTDATPAVAEAHGARVVFEPHNQIARARNTAAERSRGEWLIFLDADSQVTEELLTHTIRAIRAGGVCGGGTLVKFDRAKIGFVPSLVARLWNFVSAHLHLAAGAYVFCLRTAWEAVGGFDQRVYAGEELFFSRAVRKWGRPRGLKFRVLRETAIVTSARKLDWYGPWELLGQMAVLAIPGSIKRRNSCGHWYGRMKG
jgi:glycosyltransferase involved in cell wall biosynthesis